MHSAMPTGPSHYTFWVSQLQRPHTAAIYLESIRKHSIPAGQSQGFVFMGRAFPGVHMASLWHSDESSGARKWESQGGCRVKLA